jgi:hypothetical protein
MGWMSRLLASAAGEQADLGGETVIDGAPYNTGNAVPSKLEKPVASGDHQDARVTEEIKRRQVSLAVRYVVAGRARSGASSWQTLL